MSNYEHEQKIAREAARMAGQLCLSVRRDMLGNDDQRIEKAGKEPVTIADYGAQAVVLHQIAKVFPEDASIAEERATDFDELVKPEQQEQVRAYVEAALGKPVTLDDVRQWLDFGRGVSAKRVWTVDPIDGTKGFIRGDQFAVAVALLVDGVPAVGALACPLLPVEPDSKGERGVLASAVMGQGASIEALGGSDSMPIQVSVQIDVRKARAVESVESGHTDHSFSKSVLDRAGVGAESVRMDSQAKYVAVAMGRAEIYLRNSRGEDYREKIWDHAAGVLIVKEAGGIVTDLNGNSLDFSLGERLESNRGVLAASPDFHPVLIQSITDEDASS